MTYNYRIPVTTSEEMAAQIVAALIAAGLLHSDLKIMATAQWEIANTLSVHLPLGGPHVDFSGYAYRPYAKK